MNSLTWFWKPASHNYSDLAGRQELRLVAQAELRLQAREGLSSTQGRACHLGSPNRCSQNDAFCYGSNFRISACVKPLPPRAPLGLSEPEALPALPLRSVAPEDQGDSSDLVVVRVPAMLPL